MILVVIRSIVNGNARNLQVMLTFIRLCKLNIIILHFQFDVIAIIIICLKLSIS